MAIFNEAYIELLLEKKTTEEYHEDVFKKEFKFVPDKGSNGRSGTITVDGKKYPIIIDKSKDANGMYIGGEAHTKSKDGYITLGKDFFRLKGSHSNERMKAILQHEIGHQKLHNINPDSDTVEGKNRTEKVFTYSGGDKKDLPKYMSKAGSKEEQDHRNSDFDKANKYSKTENNPHTNAKEFEADRYAANRTSERAIRKGISNLNKLEQKDRDVKVRSIMNNKLNKYRTKSERKEYTEKVNKVVSDANVLLQSDTNQRSKALKDNGLRNGTTYKKE